MMTSCTYVINFSNPNPSKPVMASKVEAASWMDRLGLEAKLGSVAIFVLC